HSAGDGSTRAVAEVQHPLAWIEGVVDIDRPAAEVLWRGRDDSERVLPIAPERDLARANVAGYVRGDRDAVAVVAEDVFADVDRVVHIADPDRHRLCSNDRPVVGV